MDTQTTRKTPGVIRKKRALKLKKLYHTIRNPAGFTGSSEILHEASSYPQKDLPLTKTWLSREESYSIHKPARKNFQRSQVRVGNIDEQWQADLSDMQKVKRANGGYSFMLTVIDVLSRYAWVVPIKNKSGPEIKRAFQKIFETSGRYPEKLQTDEGKEFYNKIFRDFIQNEPYFIRHFHSYNRDIKASLVERFNRTIKTKLFRYFTEKNTNRWIDVIDAFTHSYNTTKHSSHGMAPKDVTPRNQSLVWRKLYRPIRESILKKKPPAYKKGDKVRVSKLKTIFQKGYLPNWTKEIFRVKHVTYKYPVYVYTIEDREGQLIEGTFYQEELQKVS